MSTAPAAAPAECPLATPGSPPLLPGEALPIGRSEMDGALLGSRDSGLGGSDLPRMRVRAASLFSCPGDLDLLGGESSTATAAA
eukprot:2990760-Alexandrium_andersonii.AAC.1